MDEIRLEAKLIGKTFSFVCFLINFYLLLHLMTFAERIAEFDVPHNNCKL